jgi:hypothetical protein
MVLIRPRLNERIKLVLYYLKVQQPKTLKINTSITNEILLP